LQDRSKGEGVSRAGPAAVGWPKVPMRSTPVPCDPPVATTPSCAADLRSVRRRATDSSPRTHLHQSTPMPRQLPQITVTQIRGKRFSNINCNNSCAHRADPSSVSSLAWCGTRRDLPAQTPTRAAASRTGASGTGRANIVASSMSRGTRARNRDKLFLRLT